MQFSLQELQHLLDSDLIHANTNYESWNFSNQTCGRRCGYKSRKQKATNQRSVDLRYPDYFNNHSFKRRSNKWEYKDKAVWIWLFIKPFSLSELKILWEQKRKKLDQSLCWNISTLAQQGVCVSFCQKPIRLVPSLGYQTGARTKTCCCLQNNVFKPFCNGCLQGTMAIQFHLKWISDNVRQEYHIGHISKSAFFSEQEKTNGWSTRETSIATMTMIHRALNSSAQWYLVMWTGEKLVGGYTQRILFIWHWSFFHFEKNISVIEN